MDESINLDVLPIKEMRDVMMPTSKPITENLPNTPFCMTIVAPVKSGKSVLIGNILLRFYPKAWERIIYFSPTADMDKTTKSFLKAFEDNEDQEITIFKQHSDLMNIDTYIELITDEQRKMPQEKRQSTLMVFDDCVGYKMKKLNYLCSRFRHFNITILIATQVYRRLDPIMRVNTSCAIFFKVSNNKEFMKIEEEILENVPNYLEYYNEATSEAFSFLYFNIWEQKLYKGFKTLLWEK